MRPSNVVVVVLDSLRPDALGVLGNPVCRTPTLDRLAAEGTTFTSAYAEFPLTLPFRTSLVTGTYTFPHRPWSALRPYEIHLAEVFRENGFRTAGFSDTPFRAETGFHRGFDTWEELPGKLTPASGAPPVLDGEVAEVDGRRPWLPPEAERDRRRWHNFATGYLGEHRSRFGTVGLELLVERAGRWLDDVADHEPFLLWIDSFQVHEPWLPPDPFAAMPDGYDGRFLPLPSGPDTSWLQPGELDHIRALYWGEVSVADAMLGRFLRVLDETGHRDDTAVVVLSDHGVPLGEHGRLRKEGIPLYDEHARILWMMRAPGLVPAGVRSDSLVQPPDLLPTLVDLFDLSVDAPAIWGDERGAPEAIQGRSLLPLLRGEDDELRSAAHMGAFGLRSGIRLGPWKFIDNRGERPNELYNLELDPTESVDVSAQEAELATALHRRAWRFQSRWARALRA